MPSPEFERLLKKLHSLPKSEIVSFQAHRKELDDAALAFAVGDDVACSSVEVAGVSGEWITPKSASDNAVLLYLHGGGYCVGSIDSHRPMVAHIARAANVRTLMIDYRLAPEHPFPAGLDDAVAAYEWLLEQGLAPDSIVIGGDSAGGGLTLATLLRSRDADLPMPSAAVLISPWLDLTASGESIVTCAEVDPTLAPDRLGEYIDGYCGDTAVDHPLVSPLFADLASLPPLLIQVGTAEILLDDSTRLAHAAQRLEVEVALEVWEDMFHVWHYYAEWIPEAREAITQLADFVNVHVKS